MSLASLRLTSPSGAQLLLRGIPTFRPTSIFLALAACAALGACGGSRPSLDSGDGGDAGTVLGQTCQFDIDCAPPDYVCGSNNTCTPGCTLAGCPTGQACSNSTGRCAVATLDGGGDGGNTDGGTGDGGTASATLCQACTSAAQCLAGGLCLTDSAHDAHYCSQDCTKTACPGGYQCTVSPDGSAHQCVPFAGCPNLTGTGTDGGTGPGTDGGTGTTDPWAPSSNGSGCHECGQCQVNQDCNTNDVCYNGTCVVPCGSSTDCILDGLTNSGSLITNCADIQDPSGQKFCTPLLGQCLPLPGVLGGDTSCMPSGTNSACTAPSPEATNVWGANIPVTQASSSLLLASEDSITTDSKDNMALGYIGVDAAGSSFMGVFQSLNGGNSWSDKKKMMATTPVQSDPVLVTSKWTDTSGPHERMHYVWVGYTIVTTTSPASVKDMFVESSYSDDAGATWSPGKQATTTTDNAKGTLLLDKPWVAVGPDQSLILTFSIGDTNQQHMHAVVSTDHGQTWGASVQIETGANDHGYNLGMPVFDPADKTGSTIYETYVAYTQIAAGASNSVKLVKSTDHGKTWSQPVQVSASDDQVLFEPPSIAMDGQHHLYVGYVSAPGTATAATSKFWDAMVASVDASQASPSVTRRVKVNDDQGSCFQHIHCMVTVDQKVVTGVTGGTVYAGFIDDRETAGKGAVWYTGSSDQGTSWSANKRVSDTDFSFNPDHQTAGLLFLGDYFGFVWDASSSKLRSAWSDPRNGTSSQVFYAGGTP